MPDRAPSPTDAESLLLAAEEAEAEAVAADARARAARLRLQARSADAEDSGELSDGTAVADGTAHADATPESPQSDVSGAGTRPEAAATESTEPESAGANGRRRMLAGAAAIAVICAAVASCAYMVWHHVDARDRDRRAAEFEAAARQGVVTLTTLDFSDADADVQRVLDNSTGEFHDDFRSRAEEVVGIVQESNVATEGTIDAAAVESMTENSAVVLVSATSRVTNAAGADQEPRVWRLSVTVTRDGGQAKMSKVEFVP